MIAQQKENTVTLKKTIRIIRFILIAAICIIGITYLSIRFWLVYRFQDVVAGKNYPNFVEQVRATKELPEKVRTAYSKAQEYDQTISTNALIHKLPIQLLFRSRSNRDRDNCPCFKLNYSIVSSFKDRLTVGLQLDHDVGSNKCLDYFLNNFDFYFNQIGIRNAALFYFEKPLESMNETELIELCLMTKNPSLYNPLTNPERVQRKMRELE